MGQHEGIIHFTIGQRRGIGVFEKGSSNEPLYVVKIDPQTKQVIVGPKSALAVHIVNLREVNWLGAIEDINQDINVEVKIRSAGSPVGAVLSLTDNSQARVRFLEPQFGVSPGQACVFYNGSRLMGGGWITRAADG